MIHLFNSLELRGNSLLVWFRLRGTAETEEFALALPCGDIPLG